MRTAARSIVGIAVSAAAIGYVVIRMDVGAALRVLGSTDLLLVAGVALCIALDLVCRTRRWQALLAPFRTPPFGHTLAYILLGYLANNVLPARLGELVRAHYVGVRESLSRVVVVGTIVVERLVDTSLVAVIAVVALLILGVGGAVELLIAAAAAGILLIAATVAGVLAGRRLPVVRRATAGVRRWPVVARLMRRLADGLLVAADPRRLLVTIGWSALAWAATVAGFVLAARAVGTDLSPSGAALMASGVALVSAIPAGPAYLGTFEVAGGQIGAAIGLPAERALALTLLVHAVTLAVTSIGGAAAFVWVNATSRTTTEPRVAGGPLPEPAITGETLDGHLQPGSHETDG